MDPQIRFVGVSDKNSTIIEDGMGNNLSSTLDAHLKELKDLCSMKCAQMDKISFVIMSLKKEEKNTPMLLVNMELTDHIPLLHLMRH
jgi:hypothetical protein